MFAALFRKKDNSLNFSVYNGLVLVQVNNLADSGEVARIKKLASEAPQTLAAFTGSSGKSVKILLPFTLPDGSLPQTKELAELFPCVGLPSCGEPITVLSYNGISLLKTCLWNRDADIRTIRKSIITLRLSR